MMYQDIYNCICQNTKNEDILSIMSNPQSNCCLKIDFQKVDQHAGGKWLIHDTKRRKYNQLQSLKLPYVRESKATLRDMGRLIKSQVEQLNREGRGLWG